MSIKKIVVIGGGISGLAAAHRLAELRRDRACAESFSVTLLEASNRAGGVIETSVKEGCLLEGGPDAFLSEKPAAVRLADRLNLSEDLINTDPAFRRSFIVRRARLIPIPEGFYLMAPARLSNFALSPLVGIRTKLRMACDVFIPRATGERDESIGSFVRRRFGNDALECIAQPMVSGIYSGDPDSLSLQATMPKFLEWERSFGSVIRALVAERRQKSGIRPPLSASAGPRYSLFLTFRAGMSSLVDRLMEAISPSVDFCFGSKVESVIRKNDQWHILLAGGSVVIADAVLLALPAWQSAMLLRTGFPRISAGLEQVPYESVAIVNAVFGRHAIGHPLDGFGFVVPRKEKHSLVACSFSSVKFGGRAPEGKVLLRIFTGGVFQRGIMELGDDELAQRTIKDLSELIRASGVPDFFTVHRYPKAMPQYQVGHLERISSLKQEIRKIKGFEVAGNGFSGIGVPDCIRQSEEAAENIVQSLMGRAYASDPLKAPLIFNAS